MCIPYPARLRIGRRDRRNAHVRRPGVAEKTALAGDATPDAQKNRAGGAGGALRLAPGSQAVWRFAPEARAATVDLWIFEDGSAPADPKQAASGALWGIRQSDGPLVAVGAIYAPYLSGERSYAAADYRTDGTESPWQKVQYLGGQRAPGWHRWTFTLDADKGLALACDGQAFQFNWNATRLCGANELVLIGDSSRSGQILWVDDVTVTPGPAMRVTPLWPPPPPADLVRVPAPATQTATPYAAWKNGINQDPAYFPVAVWLQNPMNAAAYKAAGVNLYIGLWNGPTEEQLSALKAAGMPVICKQNEVALRLADTSTIVGWLDGDEPDNAHVFKEYWGGDVERLKDAWPEIEGFKKLGPGQAYNGYGPPIPPRWIVRDYKAMRAKDPTRPVLINLGDGVANERFIGRGERTGKLEDYPEYIKGCDIVSFDIYPAVHDDGALRGNLWYVAQGVARLRRWSRDEKIVWNCIECSRIGNVNVKPTPAQIRSEVWMSIIHGSRGLIYFVHQFRPTFNESALLSDPKLLDGVTAINNRVRELAPVINSPTVEDAVQTTSSNPLVPVHATVKRQGKTTYLLSVAMYHRETEATFRLKGIGNATAEVLDEGRTVPVKNGVLRDTFVDYAAHLYRIVTPE